MICTGSMCDPYLPAEEELRLTRRCLEIIDQNAFGVSVLTKSSRVLRDFDLLYSINEKAKSVVQMTLTTYDESLCRIIEPNVSTSSERYKVLLKFKEYRIPTIVWLTPVLPYINDDEKNLKGILDYCIDADVKGIICFGMGVTLRDGNREYFYRSLDKYFPDLKQKYINQYGDSYEILSPNNNKLMNIFYDTCSKYGIISNMDECFRYINHLPNRYEQISFF